MLDKKVESILNYLNIHAGVNYTVLEKQEVLRGLPKKLAIEEREFSTAINYLQEKEYISVKYEDDKQICVAVTTRTESYLQYKDTQVERTEFSKRQFFAGALLVFFSAFLGTLGALLLWKLLGL